MFVYHRTTDGALILRDGFRDRVYPNWITVASTEQWARVVLETRHPNRIVGLAPTASSAASRVPGGARLDDRGSRHVGDHPSCRPQRVSAHLSRLEQRAA